MAHQVLRRAVGGDAAAFAVTEDAVVDGVNVASMSLCRTAWRDLRGCTRAWGRRADPEEVRREFDLPEIDVGIGELDAVDRRRRPAGRSGRRGELRLLAESDLAQSEPFVGS